MARLKTKKGKSLTRADVKALSEEAERGYDVSKLKGERVRRGRPSLDRGISPRISYRVPRRVYARVKKQARADGRTISEIAREALERYLDATRD